MVSHNWQWFSCSLLYNFQTHVAEKHFPDIFSKTAYILGSKDYINYKMTGNIVTDHSYASGTGGYNLHKHNYEKKILGCS